MILIICTETAAQSVGVRQRKRDTGEAYNKWYHKIHRKAKEKEDEEQNPKIASHQSRRRVMPAIYRQLLAPHIDFTADSEQLFLLLSDWEIVSPSRKPQSNVPSPH